ncbi:hypothetical protein [Phytobacter sp. V91]|uniref:hypothetical protein n=1 Tax=Phytobacter sp. V91 TaxID=3369425 RepID=UPI003F5EECDC
METCFKDLSASQDAIREVLQTMGLINDAETLHVKPLTGGVSSNILKVSAGDKHFCLKQALPKLKVAKEWLAPLERVFAEIDWMKTVAHIAPNAVPHIKGVDRSALCFVMDYLPTEKFSNWKSQLLNGNIDVAFAGMMGEVLGKVRFNRQL